MGWRQTKLGLLPVASCSVRRGVHEESRRQPDTLRDERSARIALYGVQHRSGDVWVLGPSGSYCFRDMRPWEGM